MSPLVSLQDRGGWHCPPSQRCLQAAVGAGGPLSPHPHPPLDFNCVSKRFLRGEDQEGSLGPGWQRGGPWGSPPGARLGRELLPAPACTSCPLLRGINILNTQNPPHLCLLPQCPPHQEPWMEFLLETLYWGGGTRGVGVVLAVSPVTSEQVPALGAAPPAPASAAGPRGAAVAAVGAAGALRRETE